MNLKEYMIDYVGNKHNPDTDDVTVDMVVETLAEEFPEFLLMVAEENYIRGYEQALMDSTPLGLNDVSEPTVLDEEDVEDEGNG